MSSTVASMASPLARSPGMLVGLTISSVLCIACVIGLVFSAFSADPSTVVGVDCTFYSDSIASEMWEVLTTFTLGWFCCMVARRRQDLADGVGKVVSLVTSGSAFAISTFAGIRQRSPAFARGLLPSKGVIGIIVFGILCSGCIIGLIASAFVAVPGEEPADDGVSESSTLMKAFTIGWIFCLSLKLRRELIGVVGSSLLFQPF